MQSTQNTGIFDASLALISTDMEAWSNLLAEDAIMEIPYAAAIVRHQDWQANRPFIATCKQGFPRCQI
jgi:hypothetical protein